MFKQACVLNLPSHQEEDIELNTVQFPWINTGCQLVLHLATDCPETKLSMVAAEYGLIARYMQSAA